MTTKRSSAARKAVEIHRRFAAGNPTAHDPPFARPLDNLPGWLAGAGRPQEAALVIFKKPAGLGDNR